jgi:D-lactate dehydrogenase
MARLAKTGHEPHIAASLAKDYKYEGNETCATDGLCATACPVKIDTGKLVKDIRKEEIGKRQARALWIADRMAGVTASARVGLSVVGFFH